MTEINLDTIARLLREEHELANAYVEQTGGGCATIYAGPTREDPDYGTRHAAVAGPGRFGWDRHTASTADLYDFYVGPDDDGQSEPIAVVDVGASTEAGIARLIAAQAKKDDPSTPLDADAVEALGFDGTGRGGHVVEPLGPVTDAERELLRDALLSRRDVAEERNDADVLERLGALLKRLGVDG